MYLLNSSIDMNNKCTVKENICISISKWLRNYDVSRNWGEMFSATIWSYEDQYHS